MAGARHLYLHLPFCSSRCGYCDFVTVVGRQGDHGRYVAALLAELVVRDAGIDNVSLDLIYGIPGQRPADLARDIAEALALEPEHVSAYELEAKPGTRFTHAHGAELERQAESMETYFERVVETLTAAGYRWYETANFCH